MPYHRYTLATHLTPHEVAQVLRANIRAPQEGVFDNLKAIFGKDDKHGTWYGVASRQDFKLQRHITYRNSFLPVVIGRIQRKATGSKIDVTMRLHLSVWCMLALFVFVCLSALFTSIQATTDIMSLIVPTVMLIFITILTLIGFNVEKHRAKDLLQQQLQASG